MKIKCVRIVWALATMLAVRAAPAAAQCCGDCNGDGEVTVNELVAAVNRALGSCSDDGVCTASVATCNTDLASCNTSLSTIQASLATCNGDIGTCNTTLTNAQASLTACNTSLSSTQTSLATCNGGIATCNSNLTNAQASLATCNTSLTSTQTSLATCNGGLDTCNTTSTQCQADLTACRSQSAAQAFPATGQTTCWDTDGNPIACSGTGQDGQQRVGSALAYVDNGDGTITDLNTHLMWEKKSDDDGLHDKDTKYTWANAFNVFIAALNDGGGFAGHTDWRLPNVRELHSIVNYENASPAVSAEFNSNCGDSSSGNVGCSVTACSCTRPDYYWASSTYVIFPIYAWSTYFLGGFEVANVKTVAYPVRAVRGGM